MPKYRVTGAISASKYLGEFEASSPEEAIEMALNSDAGHVSICHQCSDQVSDPEIHTAEAYLIEE